MGHYLSHGILPAITGAVGAHRVVPQSGFDRHDRFLPGIGSGIVPLSWVTVGAGPVPKPQLLVASGWGAFLGGGILG